MSVETLDFAKATLQPKICAHMKQNFCQRIKDLTLEDGCLLKYTSDVLFTLMNRRKDVKVIDCGKNKEQENTVRTDKLETNFKDSACQAC